MVALLRQVVSLLSDRLVLPRRPGSRHGAGALPRDREGEAGALEALERRVRRVRELLDAVNEGLVTVDNGGLITWANRGLCEMTGYALDEIVGHHPTDFLDEENRRIFHAEFGSREGGNRRRYEIDWIRKDGTVLNSLVAPQPLYDEDERFTGSVSVISDVTALKEAERALRTSERQFRELVDHASSVVLRWGVDGTIHFINPFGLHLFGYAEEEVVGRNVIGTIVPETDSSGTDLVAMIADIGAHPERYLFNENETRDRAGNRFWVVWTNRGLKDEAGRITEVLSIGTDITEIKRARVELARQRDELAELNQFIRHVFGRYVSDAVMRNLLDSPEGLEVGGTTRRVTILVADVRGFSSICEDLDPEQVIALLNTHLEVMTAVIEDHDGTIDEFIGDAILVLFGAPLPIRDHAERAVACALAMQLAMDEVNRRNESRGLPALEMGIGVHTGEVVVGNIGSIRRAKYGAVGASVNLASRLESYTVGGQILISEPTRREVGEDLVLGSCLRVEPKGVQRPLAVHEVLGLRGAHGLRLPPRDEALHRPAVPLECEFFVMEEKFVGRTPFEGRITRLSQSGAEMCSDTPPPLLSNLRLEIRDEAGCPGPRGVYAKVVRSGTEGGPHVVLHFTSVGPGARRFIEERLAFASLATPEVGE